MGIQLKEATVVNSGECINCYRCVDVCPKENVTANPNPAVAGTIAAVGIAGLYYAGTLIAPKISQNNESISASGELTDVLQKYKDGVYTGTGFRGKISVEVTVDKGLITDITIISSDDDKEFFNRASSVICRLSALSRLMLIR